MVEVLNACLIVYDNITTQHYTPTLEYNHYIFKQKNYFWRWFQRIFLKIPIYNRTLNSY